MTSQGQYEVTKSEYEKFKKRIGQPIDIKFSEPEPAFKEPESKA